MLYLQLNINMQMNLCLALSSRACPPYSSLHLHNTFAASSATAAGAAVAAVVALTCIKLQRMVAEHNLCRHTTVAGAGGKAALLPR